MSIQPYLFFGGNCAEAMRFYETALGAKLEMMMTYGEGPEGACPEGISPDKIMHAALILKDGSMILASDDMTPHYKGVSGFAVAVSYDSAEEVARVFNALAEGGQVFMPLGPTFWTDSFGMLADRYGVGWMVSTTSRKA